jgi:hypothetical protein
MKNTKKTKKRKSTKKLLDSIAILSIIFGGAAFAFTELLSRPEAFTFLEKREASLPPRLAAFHEREKESAEKMRQTAERDQAEAAKRIGPPPTPRIDTPAVAVAEKPKRRLPRVPAIDPDQPFDRAFGYAPDRSGNRPPRQYPMFEPSQGFRDRDGN